MRHADIVSGIVLAAGGLLTIFLVIPRQIAPGPEGYMSRRLLPTMMTVLIAGPAALLVGNSLRTGRKGMESAGAIAH
jgi:hypothetical protein